MGFIKNNFTVLFLYLVLLTVSVISILSYEKYAMHIYLNGFVGNPNLDVFFYYITYLGDGRLVAFILLVILLLNVRTGICAAVSFLCSSLVANALKYTWFDDVNRPHFVLKWVEKYPLKMVEGVDLHIHNSFPSGHATQAFAIMMCLVFVTKNRYMKMLYFLLALFTALSRVYLSQHWLVDITVGSILGLGFSLLAYYIIIHRKKLERLNKPLSALRKK